MKNIKQLPKARVGGLTTIRGAPRNNKLNKGGDSRSQSPLENSLTLPITMRDNYHNKDIHDDLSQSFDSSFNLTINDYLRNRDRTNGNITNQSLFMKNR